MGSAILGVRTLGAPPWETLDPFLFCVHHKDAYPAGNEALGPSASLEGRRMGMDFAGKDGWSMYHGEEVPGFPRHPHRGFETVTIARSGYIDHSDSLGATARFGNGDVQWMTAGAGVVHAEMFPLVRRDQDNPTELFQLWLNLPSASKMVPAHFTMLWGHTIPQLRFRDEAGAETLVTVVAGSLEGTVAPKPPPDSWASDPRSGLAIWTLRLAPEARWTLPAAEAGLNRALYFFSGAGGLRVDGQKIPPGHLVQLRPEQAAELRNGSTESEALLLQGRPIGEPVVQHGPFVMNSPTEIRQAFIDYQRTGFGGWPWRRDDPVHAREAGRFAIHADGREERPPTA